MVILKEVIAEYLSKQVINYENPLLCFSAPRNLVLCRPATPSVVKVLLSCTTNSLFPFLFSFALFPFLFSLFVTLASRTRFSLFLSVYYVNVSWTVSIHTCETVTLIPHKLFLPFLFICRVSISYTGFIYLLIYYTVIARTICQGL